MMKLEKFYSDCKNIPSNPYDRISPNVKSILDSNNFVIDTHCHLFPRTTLNLDYILLRLPSVIGEIVGEEVDFNEIKNKFCRYIWALGLIPGLSSEDKNVIRNNCLIKSDNNFLAEDDRQQILEEIESYLDRIELMEDEIPENKDINLGKKLKILKLCVLIIRILNFESVKDVYNFYKKRFLLSKSKKLKKYDHTIVVAPMMDLETAWDNIKVELEFKKSIEEHLEIIKEEPILPFFAVHPNREDLYEQFLNAFIPRNEGDPTFYGVKVYPALGYDPSDYRLMPIYKICSEKNIPVMTHCGGNIVHSFRKEITTFPVDLAKSNIEKGLFGFTESKYDEESETDLSEKLNHPNLWTNVLLAFGDKFHLNLAHFGGGSCWRSSEDVKSNDRIRKVIEFMETYKGVYADFSFNIADENIVLTNFFKEIVMNKTIRDKSLYGTDFWVVTPTNDLKKVQDKFTKMFQSYMTELAIHNPINFLNLRDKPI